jgi:hypothetical protein
MWSFCEWRSTGSYGLDRRSVIRFRISPKNATRPLHRLDDLPVPGRRVVDNAGFFAAGGSPGSISDAALYDRLLQEFPQWLADARAAGIVQS